MLNLIFTFQNNDKSRLYYTWFSSSWPNWTIFWTNLQNVAPRSGVRHLAVKSPNILLNSLSELFSKANELSFMSPASFSIVDSSLIAPTPLINIRVLATNDLVPGLELLLDGVMLPRLQSLHGPLTAIFIAFARRADQSKTLDTINHLVIIDQLCLNAEKWFAFKQWYIVLDAIPRLRRLIIQFYNSKCPPMEMADLLADYMRRVARSPLTLLSCSIDHSNDADNKEHFINYLETRIRMVCAPVKTASIDPTRLDAWC